MSASPRARPTKKRTAVRLPLVLLVLLAASPAHAEEPAEPREKRADQHFFQGRAALAAGQLVEACTQLELSDRTLPSGRAVLNLAVCYERRGMTASAHAMYLEGAERAVAAHRPDAERVARERAAALEPRLARIALTVPKEAEVAGLEVRHNGAVVPPSAWNSVEASDPGEAHTFVATAPGRAPWTTTLIASEAVTLHAQLRWEQGGAAPAPPATAPASPREDGHPSGGARPLAFTLLGVGLAGVAVGTIGGVMVLSAKGTVADHCDATRACDQEGLDASSRGSTWSVVSPIAFGVGVASAAAGAWLLLHSPNGRVTASPDLSPHRAGLVVSATF